MKSLLLSAVFLLLCKGPGLAPNVKESLGSSRKLDLSVEYDEKKQTYFLVIKNLSDEPVTVCSFVASYNIQCLDKDKRLVYRHELFGENLRGTDVSDWAVLKYHWSVAINLYVGPHFTTWPKELRYISVASDDRELSEMKRVPPPANAAQALTHLDTQYFDLSHLERHIVLNH